MGYPGTGVSPDRFCVSPDRGGETLNQRLRITSGSTATWTYRRPCASGFFPRGGAPVTASTPFFKSA